MLELTVSTLNLEDMLTYVVEELRDLFDSERCILYVLDRKSNELFTMVAQQCGTKRFTLPLNKRSIAGYSALTGEELMIADVNDEKELKKIDGDLAFEKEIDDFCNFKTRNMLCCPIKYKGETIGVFQAQNKPGGYLKKDFDALREFAMILGLALNNALAVEELKQCNLEKTACLVEKEQLTKEI